MSMRTWCLVLLLVLGCRGPKIIRAGCDEVCSPADSGFTLENLERGSCRPGRWDCKTDTCVGAVFPKEEQCGTEDLDCDGLVGNVPPRHCPLVCGSIGYSFCTDGQWGNCVGDTVDAGGEICDGIDNDCNGKIDDGIPSVPCYDWDAGTLGNGICHPGSTKCIVGQTICINEQGPMKEICDGIDNDCNGVIDDIDGGISSVDVVIVFDNSGSMGPYVQNLQLAASTWAITYQSQPEKRFALVTAPDPDMTTWGQTVHVYQPFTGPGGIEQALYGMGSSGSGSEPTIDAVYLVSSPGDPLVLRWAPGAKRRIVLFSDEQPGGDGDNLASFPQPTYGPGNVIDAGIALTTLAASDVQLFVFTDPQDPLTGDWDMFVAAGRGAKFNIREPVPDLISDLDKVIQSTCLADGGFP